MTDSVYVKVRGDGPDMVLVHGWGMHGGIWPEDMLSSLASRFRLHIVDLPGHGRSSALTTAFTLESVSNTIVEQLLPQVSDDAVWLGWSLGGLLATKLALQQPVKAARLIIVASSLRFTQSDDWPHAVKARVLSQFSEQLKQDYRATLSRFLALQFIGDAHARESLRLLRTQLFSRGEPDLTSLEGGLAVLLRADLRNEAAKLALPVLLVGGEHDTLAPATALAQIAERLPQAQVEIIKGASHAPFISHTDEFLRVVSGFTHG